MANEHHGKRLRGRVSECEALRRLISDAQSGTSRVLVLRGEPGVGKTALLDEVAELASGFRCVRMAGVQSDMELAFAGLQQLCAPILHHLEDLPEPQREALNVAFGRGVGAAPDRFLVGLAVLSLASAAANDRPLLLVIDDVQWLDQVSIQTLTFVARRLLAEPVAMVFAVRDRGAPAVVGLPELVVTGLSTSAAAELLSSVVLGRLDSRVCDRIVAETRGVPLALLEVPRNVSATELAGGFRHVAARRSAGELEESFVDRITSLPFDSQRLLLLAAAEPVGDAAVFLRAAARLDIPVERLAPAEAAGLIEFGPHLRFHHPLVRSAAYRGAELSERRLIHRALAQATDPQRDPDRRAWHAASAATGPDDGVAADLEASAGRARSRGGIAAAANFLQRAVALTSDPALRAARALAAAQAMRDAADPTAAREMLAVAAQGLLSNLQRAQAARLHAQMDFARSRGGHPGAPRLTDAAVGLLNAARQLESVDDELAREAYLEALAAAMYVGRLGPPDALIVVAQAALAAIDRAPTPHRPIDLLLSGMAHRIIGESADGTAQLRDGLAALCTPEQQDNGQALRWMPLGLAIVQETAAGEAWDDERWHQLAVNMVRQVREAGALAALPAALVFRAGAHLLAGEFVTAETLIDEADSIAAATDYAQMRYHSLSLIAWRGDAARATESLNVTAANGIDLGEGRVLGLTAYLTAMLNNGLARYEEAFAAAREGCAYEDLGFHRWSLLELIEAAMRIGEPRQAMLAARRIEELVLPSGTDFGLGFVASARALIAESDTAESFFAEGIEHLGRTRMVVHLARAHLRYGEWLRRVNRRVDARLHLNTAHEMFERMGAHAFAERARRELIALGQHATKHTSGVTDELTSQEAQIARLARDGLTNQEIATQLFISTHTVEWHLRKVFLKLGITKRRQLRTIAWAH